MTNIEIEFPILLSDLVLYIKSLKLNYQKVQRKIGADLQTLEKYFAGYLDTIPDMNPEEVFFIWELLADTATDSGISVSSTTEFVAQVTEMLESESQEDRKYILIAFGQTEDGDAIPLIARKDRP